MTRQRPEDGLVVAAADLRTGDRLLRLGGVGYAQLRDPDSPPVLIAEVRPPLEDPAHPQDPAEVIVEVVTSTGILYARAAAPALVARDTTVTPGTILLISRRAMLHARLLELGVPVIRRTPHTPGTMPAVTATEWATAPLIVIDGYLACSTLHQMWRRGDLTPRTETITVGTDPDDPRAEARQQAARTHTFRLLPHDKADLAALFRAATHTDPHPAPYLGILTPHPSQPPNPD